MVRNLEDIFSRDEANFVLKQILSVALQLLAMNQHVKIIYGIVSGLCKKNNDQMHVACKDRR